jgi:hypothetical protein
MGVGGQRHVPAALPPGMTRHPLHRRLGGSGRVRKISPPPGFDPRTLQPVASHYTDWAILGCLQGEVEVIGQKPVPVSVCPQQTSYGLVRNQTLAFTVKSRWPTAFCLKDVEVLHLSLELEKWHSLQNMSVGSTLANLRDTVKELKGKTDKYCVYVDNSDIWWEIREIVVRPASLIWNWRIIDAYQAGTGYDYVNSKVDCLLLSVFRPIFYCGLAFRVLSGTGALQMISGYCDVCRYTVSCVG